MKIIPIRFEKELLEKIVRVAKDLGLPISTTIKFLLNEILKSEKYGQKTVKKEKEREDL